MTTRWWVQPGETLWRDVARDTLYREERELARASFLSDDGTLWGLRVTKGDKHDDGLFWDHQAQNLTSAHGGEILKHEKLTELREELVRRSAPPSIAANEQAILDLVAERIRERDFLSGRRLRSTMEARGVGADATDRMLAALNPRYLCRFETEKGDQYQPTFPGLLQSSSEPDVKSLIEAALAVLRSSYEADPDLDACSWADLKKTANLGRDGWYFAGIVLRTSGIAEWWKRENWGLPPGRTERMRRCEKLGELVDYYRSGEAGRAWPTAPLRTTEERAADGPEIVAPFKLEMLDDAPLQGEALEAVEPSPPPESSALNFETAFAVYSGGQQLGEGGSGWVYEVEDERGSVFALKMLKPQAARQIAKVQRFKNEVYFGLASTHQNIAKAVDLGFKELDEVKCPFVVMKRYASTLRKMMSDAVLPSERILGLFVGVVEAIAHAHERGIYHRDLKPENVLHDDERGVLVVADFGIAHFAEAELATLVKTRKGERLANFEYAATEQRRAGQQVDHRADVFAMGLIMNELFTGKVPAGASYARVASVQPALHELDTLIDEMIHQDADSRPNASEVLMRLRPLATSAQVGGEQAIT